MDALDSNIQIHSDLPEKFPSTWASSWGENQYGLKMSFTYKDIRQNFRWIKPGKFMMGSPVDESGREGYETLHEVILTKGFWLADAACTQELWQAVMGNNPSSNKGEKHPVENVSWENCQEFIKRMNNIMPRLKMSLPTEAQWEYACRAGTQTAFSFGNDITQQQANYDRDTTVEVKTFPCNNWGLYEMHGNVWEWCYDWYNKYQSGIVVNPTGPTTGDLRCIRGGGYLHSAADIRSASRSAFMPDNRFRYIGFRVSLGA